MAMQGTCYCLTSDVTNFRSSPKLNYDFMLEVLILDVATVVRMKKPMIKNNARVSTLYRMLPVIELTSPKIKVPDTMAIFDSTSRKLKKLVGSSFRSSSSFA